MRRRHIVIRLTLALLTGCQVDGGLRGHAFYALESSHAGIVVSASGPQSAGTVTADDGSYLLPHLAPGRYSVSFASAHATDAVVTQLVAVGDQVVQLDDVTLTVGAPISGVVIDASTQAPIAQAAIISSHGNGSTLSAADGSFTLFGVPLGETTVVISASGLEAKVLQLELTREGLELGSVPLRASVAIGSRPALEATVVYPDNTKAAGAKVHVTPGDLDVVADSNGAFSVARLPQGAVRLEVVLGSYHALVTNVLILEGTTGLLGSGHSLYPLADFPIPLALGVPLPTAWAQLAPDGRTWFGEVPENLLYGSLDAPDAGGTPLFDAHELALSGAQVLCIADDSSTVVVGVNASAVLVSTKSRGRSLLFDSGWVRKVPGNRLLLSPTSGADDTLMPFAFGGQPISLGPHVGYETWDWDAGRRVGQLSSSQVDVLTLSPAPHHDVLTLEPGAEFISFSPDTNWVGLAFWSYAQRALVAQSLKDFSKQLRVTLPGEVGAYAMFSPQAKAWVVSLRSAWSYDPIQLLITDLEHEVTSRYAPADPFFSPDEQYIALLRQHTDDSLSSLALAPLDGHAAEKPVANDVYASLWASDGALWVARDAQFATRTAVLSRFDPETLTSVDLPRGPYASYASAPNGRLLRFLPSGVDLIAPDGTWRRLTDEITGSSGPTFSPDGAWVLLGLRTTANQSDHFTAFRLNAAGSVPVAPEGAGAAWVGAGKLLVSAGGVYSNTRVASYVALP